MADNKLSYSELCPSSVVTHCVMAQLTSAPESSLVIARGAAVEVYALAVDLGSVTMGTGRGALLDGVGGAQLELVTRTDLFGVVEALQAVRLPGAQHDALLLAFADAKLALLELDPASRCLSTRAAHTFDALSAGCVNIAAALPPMLAVQPEGGHAAMLTHNEMLVLLALRGAAVSARAPAHTPAPTPTPTPAPTPTPTPAPQSGCASIFAQPPPHCLTSPSGADGCTRGYSVGGGGRRERERGRRGERGRAR